jgi:hypothetical protein
LTEPFPQIEINTSINQVAFVWTQDGTPATNGVATFDAEYSTLSSVEKPIISDGFNIYPNPAKDFINIEFNNLKKDELNVEIIDITGKIVKNCKYSNVNSENQTIKIDLSNLPDGIYTCNVRGKEISISQKQFVLSR